MSFFLSFFFVWCSPKVKSYLSEVENPHKSRKSLKKTQEYEYKKSFLKTQRTRLDGMLS